MSTSTVPKLAKDKIKGLAARRKSVDKATARAVGKRITDKKDLMYKYPAECDNLDKRKSFRAKTRKKLASLEKKLKLIQKGKKKGNAKETQKEIDSIKSKAFTKAE